MSSGTVGLAVGRHGEQAEAEAADRREVACWRAAAVVGEPRRSSPPDSPWNSEPGTAMVEAVDLLVAHEHRLAVGIVTGHHPSYLHRHLFGSGPQDRTAVAGPCLAGVPPACQTRGALVATSEEVRRCSDRPRWEWARGGWGRGTSLLASRVPLMAIAAGLGARVVDRACRRRPQRPRSVCGSRPRRPRTPTSSSSSRPSARVRSTGSERRSGPGSTTSAGYSLVSLSSIVRHKDLRTLPPNRCATIWPALHAAAEHGGPAALPRHLRPADLRLPGSEIRGPCRARFEVRVGGGVPFGSDVPYGILVRRRSTVATARSSRPASMTQRRSRCSVSRSTSQANPTFVGVRPVHGVRDRSDVTLHPGRSACSPATAAWSSGHQRHDARERRAERPQGPRLDGVVRPCPRHSASGPASPTCSRQPDGVFGGWHIVERLPRQRHVDRGGRADQWRATGRCSATSRCADVASIPADSAETTSSRSPVTTTPLRRPESTWPRPCTSTRASRSCRRRPLVTPVGLADILYAESSRSSRPSARPDVAAADAHVPAEYYERFVLPASGPVRAPLWTNVLTVSASPATASLVAPERHGRRRGSAVLGVGEVEAAAGVPLRALVAVGGDAAGVLEHAGQVQQVPRHERGVAVGEVVLRARPSRGRGRTGPGPASPIQPASACGGIT